MSDDCFPLIKRAIYYPLFWLIIWMFIGVVNVFTGSNKDPVAIATFTFFVYLVTDSAWGIVDSIKELLDGRNRKDQ